MNDLTQTTLERCFHSLEEAFKSPRFHEALKVQGILQQENVTQLSDNLGESGRELYWMLNARNDEILGELSTALRQIPEFAPSADTLDQIKAEEQHNLNINGGLAVSIASIRNGKLEINENYVSSLLERIGEKHVYAISLNGRMRTGKSFILNQFIKYLKNCDNPDWIELDSEDPMPFTTSGVTDSVTQGIQVWSKTYPITLADGRSVEVLLLDCQGLFANDTNNGGNALLFTLSSFLTSDLVFNDNNVLEDVLRYLDMFLQYSKAAASSSHCKHNLTFLVRDRQDDETFPFGHHTSSYPVDRSKNFRVYMFDQQGGTEQAMGVRRSILSMVRNLELYLIPHPCPVPNTNIPVAHWGPSFKSHVKQFVERKLSLENIADNLKQVNNVSISGNAFAEFVKTWSSILNNKDRLPSIGTLTEVTARVAANSVVAKCSETYERELTTHVHAHPSGITIEEFNAKKHEFLQQVRTMFDASQILGIDRSLVWAEIERKIQTISSSQAAVNSNNLRLAHQRAAAAQREDDERRERIRAEEREKQAEQEREHQRRREEAAIVQAQAVKAARVQAAQNELTEARSALDHARTNLDGVRANTTAFNYTVQIETKKRNRVMGIVVSPSSTYHTETRFNSEGYQAAVQVAESQVVTCDGRVSNAISALESASL